MGRTASLCQILLKAPQPWPRYRDFSIFQDGGRRRFGFSKCEIFNGQNDNAPAHMSRVAQAVVKDIGFERFCFYNICGFIR